MMLCSKKFSLSKFFYASSFIVLNKVFHFFCHLMFCNTVFDKSAANFT